MLRKYAYVTVYIDICIRFTLCIYVNVIFILRDDTRMYRLSFLPFHVFQITEAEAKPKAEAKPMARFAKKKTDIFWVKQSPTKSCLRIRKYDVYIKPFSMTGLVQNPKKIEPPRSIFLFFKGVVKIFYFLGGAFMLVPIFRGVNFVGSCTKLRWGDCHLFPSSSYRICNEVSL